jgi:hypothetical protein
MTSSAQLQREADAVRVGLADTLGQLRDGVAPSALSGEVIALVKDGGLSIVKALVEQARANPVPALLIGAGLTMLLTRTTGGDVMGVANSALKSAAATGAGAARSAASGVASAASSAAVAASGTVKDAVVGGAERASAAVGEASSAVRESVVGTVDQARERATETYATAKDKIQATVGTGRREVHDRQDEAGSLAREAEQKARTMAEEARQSLSRLLEEQPILMAALGAALGAAVGAALPITQAEKDLIGPTAGKAVGAGREALSTAADVLRQQAAAADLGLKAEALADKVVQGVAKAT